jgi:hypothetical protein
MRKRNIAKDAMIVFGYTMAVLFVILGFYLIFATSLDNTYLPKELRMILGFVFVTYGFLRSVVNFQKQRQKDVDEDEV